tara:strand:- start:8631 stop:8819 length:189 start_codon:yes stop_codon:yes gene_type:complete
MSKQGDLNNEYLTREIYRDLIRDKLRDNPDCNVRRLRKRLWQLEKRKWGELVPGVPKRRNLR